MNCERCGQSNFHWKQACSNCGAPLTPPSPAPVHAGADDAAPAATSSSPAVRDLQLALPEYEDPRQAEARETREALAQALPTSVALVTPALLGINVIVFIAMVVMGVSFMNPTAEALLGWGATYGPRVTNGEWWRLGTAMFLHSGIIHLAMNMFALLSIGAVLERLLGRMSFLVLYTLAGLGGSLASVYWHPQVVGVGASGAIFGLYGGLLGVLWLGATPLPSHVTAALGKNAIGFVMVNMFYSLTSTDIDIAAHLGGLVTGFIVSLGLVGMVNREARNARAIRTGLVAAFGLIGIAALVPALPVTGDWLKAINALASLEKTTSDTYEQARQKVADGSLSDEDFAGLIEAKVLSPWRAQRDAFRAMLSLPAQQQAQARLLLKYMDSKADVWQVEAEAFRKKDLSLMEQRDARIKEANQAGRAFITAIGRVAPREEPKTAATVDFGGKALNDVLREISRLDKFSNEVLQDGINNVRLQQTSDRALAARIREEVVAQWETQLRAAANVKARGPIEGTRQRVEEYARLRQQAWSAMARGLEAESTAIIKQANAIQRRADAMVGADGSLVAPKSGAP